MFYLLFYLFGGESVYTFFVYGKASKGYGFPSEIQDPDWHHPD